MASKQVSPWKYLYFIFTDFFSLELTDALTLICLFDGNASSPHFLLYIWQKLNSQGQDPMYLLFYFMSFLFLDNDADWAS